MIISKIYSIPTHQLCPINNLKSSWQSSGWLPEIYIVYQKQANFPLIWVACASETVTQPSTDDAIKDIQITRCGSSQSFDIITWNIEYLPKDSKKLSPPWFKLSARSLMNHRISVLI